MKKVIIIAFVISLMSLTPALACTTMLVARGASQDGSVMVAHSDDSELFDQRLVCFGPDEPMSTCYVPFYAGVTSIAAPYYTCDTTKLNQKSAWWAFNFVANWAGIKHSYMIKDIQQKQDEIEHAEIEGIKKIDEQALALYKKDPGKARRLLTTYCETQASQVVKDWWKFAWILVARYDDGYVNAPEKMAQEVGYPEDWYDKSQWPNGPTNYKKPKSKPAK